MNSTSRSVGKIFPFMLLLSLTACHSTPARDSSQGAEMVRAELKDEISLKADRTGLGELRSQIPEEKRAENDELAVILKLMNENQIKPSDLQSRYSQLVQKKRNAFRNKVSHVREKFKGQETKQREDFLSEQKTAREEFKKNKTDRKQTADFFSQQDKARLSFFADLTSARKDFEIELQIQTKDFDSYMQERQREFAEQIRLYSKSFHELEKERATGAGEGGAAAQPRVIVTPETGVSKEFEEMSNVPATPLKAGGG